MNAQPPTPTQNLINILAEILNDETATIVVNAIKELIDARIDAMAVTLPGQ